MRTSCEIRPCLASRHIPGSFINARKRRRGSGVRAGGSSFGFPFLDTPLPNAGVTRMTAVMIERNVSVMSVVASVLLGCRRASPQANLLPSILLDRPGLFQFPLGTIQRLPTSQL